MIRFGSKPTATCSAAYVSPHRNGTICLCYPIIARLSYYLKRVGWCRRPDADIARDEDISGKRSSQSGNTLTEDSGASVAHPGDASAASTLAEDAAQAVALTGDAGTGIAHSYNTGAAITGGLHTGCSNCSAGRDCGYTPHSTYECPCPAAQVSQDANIAQKLSGQATVTLTADASTGVTLAADASAVAAGSFDAESIGTLTTDAGEAGALTEDTEPPVTGCLYTSGSIRSTGCDRRYVHIATGKVPLG